MKMGSAVAIAEFYAYEKIANNFKQVENKLKKYLLFTFRDNFLHVF